MGSPHRTSKSDDSYETHEWKSEFATTQSGRNSPNLFTKLRKRFLAPPVRTVRSPRFTDEELDVLTSDLPYETNYTYAYSKIYDPSLPDHWQVPNLNQRGGVSSSNLTEVHWSAASISRQIFRILSVPFILISSVLFYLVKETLLFLKKSILSLWEDIAWFLRFVRSLFLDFVRSPEVAGKNNFEFGIYVLKSIVLYYYGLICWLVRTPSEVIYYLKQLPASIRFIMTSEDFATDRDSRADFIERNIRNRAVNSPSISPARVPRASTRTSVVRKVFTSEESDEPTEKASFFSPLTSQLNAFRSIKHRSVTPVRNRVSVSFKKPIIEGPNDRNSREDTPLSVYGLRSRNVERNTPEPTHHEAKLIRHSVLKSTNYDDSDEGELTATKEILMFVELFLKETLNNILWTLGLLRLENIQKFLRYVGLFILNPFNALQITFYTIKDYTQSLFMDSPTEENARRATLRSRKSKSSTTPTKRVFANLSQNDDSSSSQVLKEYEEQQSFFKLIPAIFQSEENALTKLKAILNLVVIDTLLIVPNFLVYTYRKLKDVNNRWILILPFFFLLMFLLLLPFCARTNPTTPIAHTANAVQKAIYDHTYVKFLNFIKAVGTFAVDCVFEIYAFFTGTPNFIASRYNPIGNLIYTGYRTVYNYIASFVRFIIGYILGFFATLYNFLQRSGDDIYIPLTQKYTESREYVSSLSIPSIPTIDQSTRALYFEKLSYGACWLGYYLVLPVVKISEALTRKPEVVVVYRDSNVEEVVQKKTEIPVIMPNPSPPVIELDKAALIAEITDKLRAELSAQFHSELSTAIEQKYTTIIENLSSQNMNYQIDNSNLEALVRQLIYEYDADKTGQVDYALESSGASVISTRCSETYNSYSRLEKIWNIPLWYSTYGPRTVIQRNSKTLFPGECWSFKTGRGYLTIELSHQIDLSSVSYEHIGKELAPGGNRQSAPKDFKIWAYQQVDDLKSRVLVGEYTYDLDGQQLQFFIAQNKANFPVKIIELEVDSNNGAAFTCLYRLRVHGKIHPLENY